MFCARCIANWLGEHDTCPVCRALCGRILLWPVWIERSIEKTRLFNLQYHFSNLARVGVGGYVPVGTREEITSWVAARVRTLRNLMAEDMFNQAN